ncbi:hypothetical protein OPV22_033524 [Ensete ventricosum]|uniref:Uncharacterized protein n=1 Tax=Ensete ventricosum TaxID=4639 RepID=A0AAV8PUI5_ENSVE|nr:hypothetical protein OPV22_033524 [Ensete ventricosum]RZS05845.1 hypothetical protein BHM03_00036410 [Ensete ventricosum]
MGRNARPRWRALWPLRGQFIGEALRLITTGPAQRTAEAASGATPRAPAVASRSGHLPDTRTPARRERQAGNCHRQPRHPDTWLPAADSDHRPAGVSPQRHRRWYPRVMTSGGHRDGISLSGARRLQFLALIGEDYQYPPRNWMSQVESFKGFRGQKQQ